MRQRNLLFFVYASSEKNLREKKESSLLERTSFLLRFGEHRDNSRNSQSVFLVVQVVRHLYEAVRHPQEDASGRFCSYKIFMK